MNEEKKYEWISDDAKIGFKEKIGWVEEVKINGPIARCIDISGNCKWVVDCDKWPEYIREVEE